MSNLSKTTTPEPEASYRSPNSHSLRRVFIGEQGIRAGWSVLVFAAIYMLLQAVVALGHLVALDMPNPIPVRLGLLQESCQLLMVAAATLAMARIERRSVLSYGYTGRHRLIRLVTGILWGFFCLSGLVGILWKARLLVFDGMALSGFSVLGFAFAWGFVFLLVGFFEESLLRGYLQHTLTRGIGFWWAALFLSVVFALGHATNKGESVQGIVEVGLAGLLFCLSLWYTKSLWWAVGFHAGWDWGQSYFYGTPDSGLVTRGHLLSSHPAGNPIWSGGTAGPEGSLLVVPLVILVGTGMWVWWGGKRGSRIGDAFSQAAFTPGPGEAKRGIALAIFNCLIPGCQIQDRKHSVAKRPEELR
jgi:membrane protease YdiL (CAAX protease family)